MLLTDVPKEESVVICAGRHADEMLRSGCITRDEHDFVRHLQTDKLTRLHGRDGTHPRGTALN